MFSYQALSESEAMAERFQLLKEGEYDAVITASEDKQSSSGNPMMDMTVSVYDENGKAHDVRDFLVFSKGMMWKIVHFANSSGLLKEYEEGQLCSEIVVGNRVKVKLMIEEGKEIPNDKLNGKPSGTKYFDKNKIEDYVKKEDQKPLENSNEFRDDEIPFL